MGWYVGELTAGISRGMRGVGRLRNGGLRSGVGWWGRSVGYGWGRGGGGGLGGKMQCRRFLKV